MGTGGRPVAVRELAAIAHRHQPGNDRRRVVALLSTVGHIVRVKGRPSSPRHRAHAVKGMAPLVALILGAYAMVLVTVFAIVVAALPIAFVNALLVSWLSAALLRRPQGWHRIRPDCLDQAGRFRTPVRMPTLTACPQRPRAPPVECLGVGAALVR